MGDLSELFPYTAAYLAQELLSPIVTPIVLYFCVRPKAADIVEFFRNFTVNVENVGDVCSFAQMDVRRHGNPHWMTPAQVNVASMERRDDDDGNSQQQPQHSRGARTATTTTTAQVSSTPYTRAEAGKTEMSLYHFAITNPTWNPPPVRFDLYCNI